MTGSASASELLGAAVYYGLGLGGLALLGYLLANSYSRIGSKIDARFLDLDALLKFLVGLCLVLIFVFVAKGGNDVLEDALPPRMGAVDLIDQTLYQTLWPLVAFVIATLFVAFVVCSALILVFGGIGYDLVGFTKSLTPAARVERRRKQHEKAQEKEQKAREEKRKAQERSQREEFVTEVRKQGRDLRDPKSDRSGSLRGANLAGCDMSKVDLFYRRVRDREIDRDMTAVDFRGANLSRTHFGDFDLSYTDFSGADLWHAILSSATLRWARFNDSNMTGTYLIGSDLRGADLSGATGSFGYCDHLLYDDDTIWGDHPPRGIRWESAWERFVTIFEQNREDCDPPPTPEDPEAFLNEHGWRAFLRQSNIYLG